MSWILVLHVAATWALVGLIWTIQLVHYPLFSRVGRDAFEAYHAAHARGISPLVSIPLHARLARGYQAATVARLVVTNWWRTAVWTARGLIVLALLRGPLR